MNPLAGIRVKIPIKQEIYKHTHTHTHTHTNNIVQGNFLSGYFGTCIFHKKMQHIDERKSKKHLKNKGMSKIL